MRPSPLRAAPPLALLLTLACRGAVAPVPGPAVPPAPGIDPTAIDPAARPCDDFYRYACGGWLARTTIPADKPEWARLHEMDERNRALLRDLAERDAAGQLDPQDRYPGKVGDYYAACMDEAAIEAGGTRDLRAEWDRIARVKDVPALAAEVARLHRVGVFPLFAISSDQDAKDATQVIGVVGQGGLSLPDRDYYLKDDARSVGLQKDYRAHVARMLSLAGVPAGRAAADAERVYALERSLAEAHWTRVELRDPKLTYHRVDLGGLEAAMPAFPWRAYLAALGHPGLTAFSVTTPRFLERLQALLASTPMETWRRYLEWKLLARAAAARALPRAFVEARFAFLSKAFTGAKELEPRWRHCVAATEGALGEAIGQAFVRRHFGADGKARTRELVSAVEGALGRDLDALAWMDAATRGRAREKLARVVNKIGYPDAWRAYDALQVDRASFFRSVLAADAFEVDRDLSKIGKPLDRGEWLVPPPVVNAYYNPSLNEIVFPAGILQPPFYTRAAPDAVNYGAVGMVVGHELTHGFDDSGRQFDAAGNLADWWSAAAAGEFERRAGCVVRQFDGYTALADVKVNGQLTLGENIADLGGVKLALAAYQASRAGRPPEAPVAGFTPEQAFFISFAQAWCTAIRPEYARLHAATDEHAPPQWRVNGPLSNLPDFQRAFSCAAGSAMVRSGEDRCEVW